MLRYYYYTDTASISTTNCCTIVLGARFSRKKSKARSNKVHSVRFHDEEVVDTLRLAAIRATRRRPKLRRLQTFLLA